MFRTSGHIIAIEMNYDGLRNKIAQYYQKTNQNHGIQCPISISNLHRIRYTALLTESKPIRLPSNYKLPNNGVGNCIETVPVYLSVVRSR